MPSLRKNEHRLRWNATQNFYHWKPAGSYSKDKPVSSILDISLVERGWKSQNHAWVDSWISVDSPYENQKRFCKSLGTWLVKYWVYDCYATNAAKKRGPL